MADEVDIANMQAERWLNQALANRQTGPVMPPKGRCYYCERVFEADEENAGRKLFCDIDCSQDYEAEQRRNQRR